MVDHVADEVFRMCHLVATTIRANPKDKAAHLSAWIAGDIEGEHLLWCFAVGAAVDEEAWIHGAWSVDFRRKAAVAAPIGVNALIIRGDLRLNLERVSARVRIDEERLTDSEGGNLLTRLGFGSLHLLKSNAIFSVRVVDDYRLDLRLNATQLAPDGIAGSERLIEQTREGVVMMGAPLGDVLICGFHVVFAVSVGAGCRPARGACQTPSAAHSEECAG